MINFALLDGMIYVPYSFVSDEYKEFTTNFLKNKCTVPIIQIAAEDDDFPAVWYNDTEEILQLVCHMIEEHHCRDIIFMTGSKENAVSQKRAEGFIKAMEKHGLAYNEDDIVYGDFWIMSSKQLAESLTDGTRTMPDAVVCSNDAMAISLCDALMMKGISVPNDIRIAGYDGYLESRFHAPSITTYMSALEQLGRNAFCALYHLITDTTMLPFSHTEGRLIRHESCGCGVCQESCEFLDFDFTRLELGVFDNNLTAIMFDSNTLDDFFSNTYSMIFTFMSEKWIEQERISICLCEDWDNITDPYGRQQYRSREYSENMLCFHQQKGTMQFSLKNMKPSISDSDKYPVTIFNALHFLDHCFGYICFESAASIEDYNRDYIRFIREVNNGLNFFCSQNKLKRALYREQVSNKRDTLTGIDILRRNTEKLESIRERSEFYQTKPYVLVIVLTGLQYIMNTDGSEKLDQFLMDFSILLQKQCGREDSLFQIDENKFAIIGVSNNIEAYCNELTVSLQRQILNREILHNASHIAYLRTEYFVADSDEYNETMNLIEKIERETVQIEKELKSMISSSIYSTKLLQLRKDIYTHPEADWSMEYCVGFINVSRSYLHRIYKKLFDCSIAEDIKNSRLSYAKYLLVTTDNTLQVIAEKCRIDYFNFMRLFKKEIGITPTEYRHMKQP